MRKKFEKMMDLYEELKREIRQRDEYLFERWKASGFLIDNDIISMYPNLGECIESLEDEDDEDDEEPEDDEDEE